MRLDGSKTAAIVVMLAFGAADAQQQTPADKNDPEAVAWNAAVKNGGAAAYLDFQRDFPQSARIKTAAGTVRGRYWFKMRMPFDSGNQADRNGVLVTFEGGAAYMNTSLDEARRLKLIGVGPHPPAGKNIDGHGTTFNYTYVEVTAGGSVVGDETIRPIDYAGVTAVLSADGKRLLAVDLSKAMQLAQPSSEPTMSKGPDGEYPCGAACP